MAPPRPASDLDVLLLFLTTVIGLGAAEAMTAAEAIVTSFIECDMEVESNEAAAPAA